MTFRLLIYIWFIVVLRCEENQQFFCNRAFELFRIVLIQSGLSLPLCWSAWNSSQLSSFLAEWNDLYQELAGTRPNDAILQYKFVFLQALLSRKLNSKIIYSTFNIFYKFTLINTNSTFHCHRRRLQIGFFAATLITSFIFLTVITFLYVHLVFASG